MLEHQTVEVLRKALSQLEAGFSELPGLDSQVDFNRVEEVLFEVARKMQDNYPYFHPYYAGQMLKPPHPVAQAAYMLSMWINPNNHALDGGRASSQMEKEAVAELARMFGWEKHLGHLTSGGTMANMEALWISRQLNPGKVVLASEQAHYTHSRISGVLGIDFESVPCDPYARMDLDALEARLAAGGVGTVVATIGTTATGSVDPLPEILSLKERYGFRLHADAAYGGYFTLVDNLGPGDRAAYDCLGEVDSIVVDPHKHGLQPYGCGCILYRDPEVGKFYVHDSPYTYFTSPELHLGEISLECSRAGASAVGLWATQKMLPLERGGEFARRLAAGREAALALYQKVKADKRFKTIFKPSLDILVWAPDGTSGSQISRRTDLIFEAAAAQDLHLAKFKCPASLLEKHWEGVDFDQEVVVCLRSCLMKPEQVGWVDQIWDLLDGVVKRVMG